jgi:hypothetical protein
VYSPPLIAVCFLSIPIHTHVNQVRLSPSADVHSTLADTDSTERVCMQFGVGRIIRRFSIKLRELSQFLPCFFFGFIQGWICQSKPDIEIAARLTYQLLVNLRHEFLQFCRKYCSSSALALGRNAIQFKVIQHLLFLNLGLIMSE